MTDPMPRLLGQDDPAPTQVTVRMLQPLGGHDIGDEVAVDIDLVNSYVAAGYVERLQ